MSPRHKGRQAVYLGVVPIDWKPCSLWSVPPSLSDVELYEKNLSMRDALGYARAHNKRELQNNRGNRRWAVVSRHLRARCACEHPDAIDKRRAGGGDKKSDKAREKSGVKRSSHPIGGTKGGTS